MCNYLCFHEIIIRRSDPHGYAQLENVIGKNHLFICGQNGLTGGRRTRPPKGVRNDKMTSTAGLKTVRKENDRGP